MTIILLLASGQGAHDPIPGATYRSGQGVHDLDLGRDLVVRQACAAPLYELVRRAGQHA